MEELADMRVNGTRKMGIAVGRYQSAVTKRRMLLSETDVKLEALNSLVTQILRSNGALIFTETISAAEKAADRLNELGVETVAMHSQLKPRERQAVFEGFKNGDIKAIVAPHLLDEGVDVPEADLGIILAATRTRRQMVQRMGRVLRLKSDNRMATFIIVYIAGTTEDPDKGAHESFFSDILSIAE
jgi:superfamily II DNA or RNA helicase